MYGNPQPVAVPHVEATAAPKQRVIRYRESGCAVHQSNHTKSAQFPVIAVLKLSATRWETQHNSTNRDPEACKH